MASGTNGVNPSSVTVKFWGNTTGIVGDDQIHTDTSLGISPAYLFCRPSRRSSAALWQTSSSAIAFYIVAPSGSIIDLGLSYRDTPGQGIALQNATVGAQVGSVFYRGLDGLAIASSQLIPPDAIYTK